MWRALASRWLACLCLSFPLLAAEAARACSICLAGDPQFSSFGADAGSPGSFSLYTELRGFGKKSDALEGGTEESTSERLDLYANWTPVDRLGFTLDVPYAWNRIEARDAGVESRATLAGIGDVSLAASVVLWRDRAVLPSRWLEARLWGKAPTGRDTAEVDGEQDPHLQPGTGSWDWGLGLAAAQRFEWGSLYGSAFHRWNQPGSLHYEFGDVWLATLGVEAPLGHLLARPWLDFLTPGLSLDFRYAGYDEAEGKRYSDSGGSILYATPSLRIRLPWAVREQPTSLRLGLQVPLGQSWLHNQQYEKVVWSFGVLVPF